MIPNITIPRFSGVCDSDIVWLQSLGKVDRMKSVFSVSLRRALLLGAAMVAIAGFAPHPAQARIFVGIGVPFFGPAYTPYPYYYPPPVYYPPPPVYYTPPPAYGAAAPAYSPLPYSNRADRGQACHASAYVCPMDRPVASGGSCYCIGNDGQKVWGRAG